MPRPKPIPLQHAYAWEVLRELLASNRPLTSSEACQIMGPGGNPMEGLDLMRRAGLVTITPPDLGERLPRVAITYEGLCVYKQAKRFFTEAPRRVNLKPGEHVTQKSPLESVLSQST